MITPKTMKYIFYFLIGLVWPATTMSQGLAAYIDFQKRFHIFDKGVSKIVEQQKVKSFKVGTNCIAYVDYADNFKIYKNGEVKTLEIGGVRNYVVTDYLMAYSMTDILKVYDNGKVTTLSANAKEFVIGDSLIVFYDEYYNSINGYYQGKVYSQRLRLIGKTIQKLKAFGNIAALITAEDRNFWIVYQGQRHLINEFVDDVQFKVGRDIVAYMDEPTRTFKAFYQNEIYDLENFIPKSYWMGSGRVVYVDQNDNFKVFENGEVKIIEDAEPEFYLVKDSMIVYRQLNSFKCYYRGVTHTIENFIPSKYDFSWDKIVYLNNEQNLVVFEDGESKIISQGGSQALINSFELNRDVIVINTGVNTTQIYYKGQFY